MHARASWHAWIEREWKDEVAPEDEHLGRFDEDFGALFGDLHEMTRTIVECALDPLVSFAESLPRAFAYERDRWARPWRPRPWRHHA
jgi:hypothetical protein